MATDRILVHESVAHECLDIMKASLARAAIDGSPLPVLATAKGTIRGNV